ncbi:MAG: cation:proton antiporter [Gemmataceae bacterium]
MILAAAADVSWVFIELGTVVVGLAILARFAHRFHFSAIPLYLLVGLAFGNGGLVPLRFSDEFIHVGSEIGVVLLLFMLGLEYSPEQLRSDLRASLPAGMLDLVLNFPPGLVAGFWLGWSPLAAILLGGATYISSSGVVAKVLSEASHISSGQMRTVLSLLVLEDLAMAVFLPLVTVLLVGHAVSAGVLAAGMAIFTGAVVLFIALRFGAPISRWIAHDSDEVVLFTTLGIVLVVAGLAQRLQVSAAVGAFLVGIAFSGPIVQRAHRLLGPLRDLFAAIFFLFFGLQINPATLPPVLWPAMALAIVGSLTKLATGRWAMRRSTDRTAGWQAGAALIARGEFSIVLAGLGMSAGVQPDLGPLAAAFVLITAVVSPLLVALMNRRK